MQDLTLDTAKFMKYGGTELAPMSTSNSQSVAFKCARVQWFPEEPQIYCICLVAVAPQPLSHTVAASIT